jgi:large subunit ribosomal protein L10
MALALGFDDEVAPARVIFQYAKKHSALEIVGGITADGTLLSAAEVKALATLPTREQLLGQVVGTIAAPLTGFVGVMSGNVRSIINVLNALSEAKA